MNIVPELIQMIETHSVEQLDIRFTDLLGTWRHITLSARDTLAAAGDVLVPIDASYVASGQSTEHPTTLLRPVALQRGLDPFCQYATVGAIGELVEPSTRTTHSHDPRGIAGKAEAALRSAGFADQALFACELQFFVFDKAVYEQGMHNSRHEVDSREGVWRRGRDEPDNLGLQIRHGDGYGQSLPFDSMHNLRAEMVQAIEHIGVEIVCHYRAPASAAQMGIRIRALPLVAAADAVMLAKYAIRNVAARHGKVACFMAKPILGDPGSALLIEVQLQSAGRSLFSGRDRLSDSGDRVVGGWRAHAGALVALGCPTTNSYRRLGFDEGAPNDNLFGFSNHASMISLNAAGEHGAHAVLRHADASCNPYLALAAIAMAGVDGVRKKIGAGELRDMVSGGGTATGTESLPRSLTDSLAALWSDREFLNIDNVFSADAIATLMSWKLEMEVRQLEMRPHPYEFCLYFNS
ncbi:MAG: hypothetical protein JNG88_13740 [Phycisphaerales bacterium]|nr:hypothetical protein [Phycisphaerales bacterium]